MTCVKCAGPVDDVAMKMRKKAEEMFPNLAARADRPQRCSACIWESAKESLRTDPIWGEPGKKAHGWPEGGGHNV